MLWKFQEVKRGMTTKKQEERIYEEIMTKTPQVWWNTWFTNSKAPKSPSKINPHKHILICKKQNLESSKIKMTYPGTKGPKEEY